MRLGHEVLRCAYRPVCPWKVTVRDPTAWQQREAHEQDHRELEAIRALQNIRRVEDK